ncbi:MAG TPA: hypothetical protein VJR06_08320, partial [Nitrososphaerales archaeon]|nr:hypothetical protein [Nitrososphaerales archaeon]
MTILSYLFLALIAGAILIGWWRCDKADELLTLDEEGWHFHRPKGLPHYSDEPVVMHRDPDWQEQERVLLAEKLQADA